MQLNVLNDLAKAKMRRTKKIHRAFGHVPKATMVNLLRAEKVNKEFVKAGKLVHAQHVSVLHTRYLCLMNTRWAILLFGFTGGHRHLGKKCEMLSMVCRATCFQQAEVVKVGGFKSRLLKQFYLLLGSLGLVYHFSLCAIEDSRSEAVWEYLDEHGARVLLFCLCFVLRLPCGLFDLLCNGIVTAADMYRSLCQFNFCALSVAGLCASIRSVFFATCNWTCRTTRRKPVGVGRKKNGWTRCTSVPVVPRQWRKFQK